MLQRLYAKNQIQVKQLSTSYRQIDRPMACIIDHRHRKPDYAIEPLYNRHLDQCHFVLINELDLLRNFKMRICLINAKILNATKSIFFFY